MRCLCVLVALIETIVSVAALPQASSRTLETREWRFPPASPRSLPTSLPLFVPLSTGQFGLPQPYDLSDWLALLNYFGKTVTNSNPYTSAPFTGVTRRYDFTLSRGMLAPDGVEREMILVNGQFPGPMIKANWGDWIQVTVHNAIHGPDEGTAMHWHGFLQSDSQWSDGVPGTSECPIPPGQSRTYTFQAQLYGTSWYHSHYSAQYASGTWGPLVINGPTQALYDDDLGPVMLSDWYYQSYFDILTGVMGNDLTKARPASDNNLINGMGCSSANADIKTPTTGTTCTNLARYTVQKGKKYRLRIINTSAAAIQKFSIDGHNMSVISYDYVPIQPYTTNVITLGVAQRADIVITANGNDNGAYWIRSHITDGQCTEPANQPNGYAILQYSKAGRYAVPNTTAQIDNTQPCQNDDLSLTKPMFAMTPPAPSQTFNMNVNFSVNATGHLNWDINGNSFRTNYNHPMLLLAKQGNVSYPYDPEWNTVKLNSLSRSVRVVLNNLTPTSHPMHLHGHNMYVLAAGTGTWDGTVTNPGNPARRDVQILPADGYLVVQWDLDNPGVWPFHCHIAWHVSAGLQVTMIERPLDILGLPIPIAKYDECVAWNRYTQGIVVDQIDSGV